MNQQYLRSLGVSAPCIALGTVELGLPYGFGFDGKETQPTFHQAERLVHAALDLGIRVIDTARAYGDSENILGRTLGTRRNELVLATKVGPLELEGRSDAELASDVTNSVEHSLHNLRTDRVDWLMLHSATLKQIESLPRFWPTLERLREQGKARALGASIYNESLEAGLRTPEFACLQVAASVLDRRVEEARSRQSAVGKDFIIRSVLLRGVLSARYHALPASMLPLHRATAVLDRIAGDAGISLTELAYRYVAAFDGLMLVGTANIAELAQAIEYVERGPLPNEVVLRIRSIPSLEDRSLNPAQWPSLEASTSGTAG